MGRKGRDTSAEGWAAAGEDLPGPIPEELRQEFCELGLSPYEARVLLALLRLGSANSLQLARVSGVPRTSTYQIVESLAARQLAARLPQAGPAVWAAADRDEVFERLRAALEAGHAQRLRQHRTHAERARELLERALPEAPSVAMPYVHVLPGPNEVKRAYEDMIASAQHDLMMFTRPPYAWVLGRPNPSVLEMLERGVTARVLYQADKWEEPDAYAFRQEVGVYHDAGVQGRLVDNLPTKLVLVDQRAALVGMTDPVAPEAGYPIALLVEHPGFAALQAIAFEKFWEESRPLTAMPEPGQGEPLPEGLLAAGESDLLHDAAGPGPVGNGARR